jgi:hypothetical protein
MKVAATDDDDDDDDDDDEGRDGDDVRGTTRGLVRRLGGVDDGVDDARRAFDLRSAADNVSCGGERMGAAICVSMVEDTAAGVDISSARMLASSSSPPP